MVKDLKKGLDVRGEADALLAKGNFEEGLSKAKEAAELLEDAGEEEVTAMGTLVGAYLVLGKTKLAMDKAKAAQAIADPLGGNAKAIAMSILVKTYLGYKLVPAAILSADAMMYPLKSSTAVAATAVSEAVRVVPSVDFMSPTVDTSILTANLDAASKAADDALALFKESGDKKGQAMAMYLSTYVKSEKRLLKDPLPALEAVLQLLKEAGATKEVELVQKDILSYYLGKSDEEGAARIKADATAVDKSALIRVVADTYFTMRDDRAKSQVMEALEAFRGAGDKSGEVGGLRSIVNLHLSKNELDDALSVADQIVGMVDDKQGKAGAMFMLSSIQLAKEGGYPEAAAALGKAQAFYKEATDGDGEVGVLLVLAELRLSNGDSDQALSSAEEAASICKRAGMKAQEASALRVVLLAQMAKDDEAGVSKTGTEALGLCKEVGSKAGEVAVLKSLAEMFLSKGNSAAAMEKATEMLALAGESGDVGSEAAAKHILANATLAQDPASMTGLTLGKEALALFDSAGDTFGAATTLCMLVNGFFGRNDLEEGLRYAREALAIFRQTGDTMNEEMMKENIEAARSFTADYRKQNPKRPLSLPVGGGMQPSTGPEVSSISESRVPKDILDQAVAARKYWGVPKQVQNDPTVDAIERAPSHAVIWGTNMSDNVATQVCVEFGDLVATMSKGDVAKIPIIVTTQGCNGRLCGEHVPYHMTGVSAATMWGMVRTVRQEIPQVQCLMYDFSGGQTLAQIPRNLRMPAGVPESSFYHNGRWEPQLAQVPSLFRRDLKRDNLTGGGGGGTQGGDPKKHAKFMRKSFNWTGPIHKLDWAWYRQEWRAVGQMVGDIGPMPPQQPCKALRSA